MHGERVDRGDIRREPFARLGVYLADRLGFAFRPRECLELRVLSRDDRLRRRVSAISWAPSFAFVMIAWMRVPSALLWGSAAWHIASVRRCIEALWVARLELRDFGGRPASDKGMWRQR